MSVDLTITKLDLEYGSGKERMLAVKDVDLQIRAGEFVTIVGPSGCGKSSLMNMVAGFIPCTRGSIKLGNEEIRGPGADRGVVFQEHALFPWMTVVQNIGYGPKVNGWDRRETEQRVAELLELIGLTRFATAWPKQLSGGMKQRVAIARALANRPKMLLMDEPFAALDAQTRRMLQDELLRIWQKTGTTVLFITHSIDEATLLSDRVAVMKAGPGEILDVIPLDLPRPRDENSNEFLEARRRVSGLLKRASSSA